MSNKAALVLLFEQGDTPNGSNFADLINSCLNLNETSTQSILGPVNPTELITPRVSATNANITGIVSSNSLYSSNISSSAATLSIIQLGTGVVSAAGSTQATAALLSYSVNIGAGVADGVTTGYLIPANSSGRIQYLFNNGVSANLYPPSGGKINGLATNAPYALAASAGVTIVHIAASSMMVT